MSERATESRSAGWGRHRCIPSLLRAALVPSHLASGSGQPSGNHSCPVSPPTGPGCPCRRGRLGFGRVSLFGDATPVLMVVDTDAAGHPAMIGLSNVTHRAEQWMSS